MSTVYIETSVVSYLRNNPKAASDSVMRQQITKAWCKDYRHRSELVTSQYVVDEWRSGNAASAAERLE
jgi:hypothetical protein